MVVAAISGCRTAERVSYHQGIEMFGYPACQGTNPNLWDNCVGSSTVITSDARTGIQTLFIYKNGSRSDGPSRIISKVQGLREVCDQNKKRTAYPDGEPVETLKAKSPAASFLSTV